MVAFWTGAAAGLVVGVLVGTAMGIMYYKKMAENAPSAPTTEDSGGDGSSSEPR
ncbi:MAG: hypothetical protein ACREK1_05530 [Longimicrobiales bacterium]